MKRITGRPRPLGHLTNVCTNFFNFGKIVKIRDFFAVVTNFRSMHQTNTTPLSENPGYAYMHYFFASWTNWMCGFRVCVVIQRCAYSFFPKKLQPKRYLLHKITQMKLPLLGRIETNDYRKITSLMIFGFMAENVKVGRPHAEWLELDSIVD